MACDPSTTSTTGAYAVVIFAADIKGSDRQCAMLLLQFSEKPPSDTATNDTLTALCYADQHMQGKLGMYTKTPSMGLAESLLQLLNRENGKLDAKHAIPDQGAQ